MKYILCILSLLTIGCAEKSLMSAAADTGAELGGGNGETLDEDTMDTGGFDEDPAWWSLGARLDLSKGIPQDGGTLTIIPRNEAGDALCEDPDPLTITAVSTGSPPHKEILSWWQLTVETPGTLCDGIAAPVGDTIFLGVGEMHPDISAAIEVMGGLDGSLPLNGAYASLDGEAVFVFGVAGQESAYTGEGEVAASAPLADGGWRIEPIYWFGY